ncbi:glycosyltransferase family 2 protein [Xanthobacter agilis]|jgi:glycosyltransferase involved in cell wall biosynthesis|uniref:Glycosyltransferase involved in cell wall biosynthesis n=1 Tax=Xanthobacter agilis TaxID=47492 RepID=A0ABU0LGK6_XANAG|nr:glycosyltransferase family 2 protein [Xanthobacter agilis]MDQ0506253.1 glycosyltransferase involved in cell wall biosynthesis [Xanthobacter agilis]
MTPDLSIVVPVYNEAAGLPVFHERLCRNARAEAEARGLRVEVVYVDDGSRDGSANIAAALPPLGLDIQVVALSRNFGKEAALMAGLDHARGDALLFMDGDGQHPPEMIPTFVRLWKDEGYDVAYAVKSNRLDEPLARRSFVRGFYWLLNFGSSSTIPEDAADFRILSPRATAALRRMPERNRFFKGLSSWIGFRQIAVPYQPDARTHGTTSFNFLRLLGLSMEALTSFSPAPLRLAALCGAGLAGLALFYGAWIVLERLIWGIPLPGYPSLVVGIMVMGGAQLLVMGLMGEYVARILSEIKARPVYFVADHVLTAHDAQTAPDAATQAVAPPLKVAGAPS